MILHLYNNAAANNVANKSTYLTERTPVTGIDCVPTMPLSILQPEFIVSYDGTYSLCNYAYVPAFGRYYYCTCTLLTGGRIRVSCTVDALYSHYASMSNCKCTVIRNENIGINIIPDTQLPVIPNAVDITSIELENSLFNTAALTPYLLTVIGA